MTRPLRREQRRIGIVVMGVVAIGFLALFVRDLVATMTFLSGATSTAGVVVEVQKRVGDGAQPIIEYEVEGARYRFKNTIASDSFNPKMGEHVEVLYSPRQPGVARLAGTFGVWGNTLIFLGQGIVFGIIAFALFRKPESVTWA